MSASVADVRHNVAARRYEFEKDGHLSMVEYAMDGSRQIFTHTFVPPELRGHGIAGKLVRTALDDARASGQKIVPACSYVAAFIKRHPEYESLVATVSRG